MQAQWYEQNILQQGLDGNNKKFILLPYDFEAKYNYCSLPQKGFQILRT